MLMRKALKIPGLWLVDSTGAVKIYQEDIIYCYHNKNVTKIVYSGGCYTTARIPLSRIEEKLCQKKFFRCHRNYLINLEYIRSLPDKLDIIIFDRHSKVLVARRRRNKLLHMLEQFKSKARQIV